MPEGVELIAGPDSALGDLIFLAAGGKLIVKFHPDGTVTLGELKPDDAARQFLDLIAELWPSYCKNTLNSLIRQGLDNIAMSSTPRMHFAGMDWNPNPIAGLFDKQAEPAPKEPT
jgi:hypothetical protein